MVAHRACYWESYQSVSQSGAGDYVDGLVRFVLGFGLVGIRQRLLTYKNPTTSSSLIRCLPSPALISAKSHRFIVSPHVDVAWRGRYERRKEPNLRIITTARYAIDDICQPG